MAALAVIASVVVLGGCPDAPGADSGATPPPKPAESPEFRAKAHADAYARLLPLARRALALADPIAEAVLGDAALMPRPFSVGGRAALRKAVDAAWIEATDIRPEYLPTEDALLLRATRFALSRLRDEQRRPSTRTDPAIGVRATAALLDEVFFRGIGCADCDAALAAAGPELDAALADLGATTPVRARAAAEDCAAQRGRLGAWRGAHPNPDALTGALALEGALDRANVRLLAIAAAIESAAIDTTDKAELRVARSPAEVARLPDRLGATDLRRALDVHESETREAKALFADLVPAAIQLGAFAASAPAQGPATPIDALRCRAAWSVLEAYAKTQPAVVAQLDCDRDRLRLSAMLGSGTAAEPQADDDDLMRAVALAGIVEPTRRATRARTEPTLARVTGDIAPAAHRHALTLAVLSGAKQAGARGRVATVARAEVCTALAAVWVHGELGDDAMLAEQLAKPCPGFDASMLVNTVIARPDASFAGLGLTLLAMGPADVAALERGWWLPLGLVIAAARPEPTQPETPVVVRSEELANTEAGAPP